MCTPTQCRYLSQGSNLLVAVAPDGTIRAIDPRHATILGHDTSDLSGKPLAALVPPDQHGHLARILARCETTPAVWDHLTFLASDGQPEPMLCCFQRFVGTDIPQKSVLVTGLRLGAVESDLRAEAAAVLGQLAYRCHGPAHRLMQAVEAILSQYPWSEAAERCREDLDALLEALSRTTAWPQTLPAGRPVDVVRVLEGTLRLIDGDPDFKHLKIELRPECPSAWAAAHPVGLAFVTLHLAANARDASAASKSPRLIIDVGCDDGQVAIGFQDNGRGLNRQDMNCAFTPFFSKAGGGDDHAGLGLATCNELVQFMGGKIRMLSRSGRGTTVLVTLPSSPAPQ